MLYRIIFKKIPISYRKIKLLVNKIRNFSFLNMIIYLTFLNNKSSIILKKVILSFLHALKRNNINFLKFKKFFISSEKGIILKRIFYKSKGRFSILKKRYSNILLSIYFFNYESKD